MRDLYFGISTAKSIFIFKLPGDVLSRKFRLSFVLRLR